MATANILIVEDESVIALDIKRSLTKLGYGVVAIADNAETALEVATHAQPDLVLMDIRLRGELDGVTAARYIRERLQLPVVFLTAHADAATLAHAKATLPFGYIVKPFETHDLSTAIEIALSRHQAEFAIQQALVKEREVNELKTHFVSIVSHEFRNPLSSIQFYLDLLSREDRDTPAEKKDLYLQRAKESVERMRQLLDEVLVVEEAETGKLEFTPAPMNLIWFCRNLVDEMQSGMNSRHAIHLDCLGSQSDEPFYSLDIKLLRHILGNLLSNAIKYSPQGSDISFDLICNPEAVTFRIADQGIGVLPDDRSRLFDRFQRGANVGNIPGTGLGLAIVKQCVETHQGTIQIHSKLGQGTVFEVTLPIQEFLP